jgi:hypothetical protein
MPPAILAPAGTKVPTAPRQQPITMLLLQRLGVVRRSSCRFGDCPAGPLTGIAASRRDNVLLQSAQATCAARARLRGL